MVRTDLERPMISPEVDDGYTCLRRLAVVINVRTSLPQAVPHDEKEKLKELSYALEQWLVELNGRWKLR